MINELSEWATSASIVSLAFLKSHAPLSAPQSACTNNEAPIIDEQAPLVAKHFYKSKPSWARHGEARQGKACQNKASGMKGPAASQQLVLQALNWKKKLSVFFSIFGPSTFIFLTIKVVPTSINQETLESLLFFVFLKGVSFTCCSFEADK